MAKEHPKETNTKPKPRKFDGRNKGIKPFSTCDKCEEEFCHADEVALHMEYFHESK